MEAVEFGMENDRKIVLIPGNMMSWKQFDKVIPKLEKGYLLEQKMYTGASKTTIYNSCMGCYAADIPKDYSSETLSEITRAAKL